MSAAPRIPPARSVFIHSCHDHVQDDPFHTELATFIDVVESRRGSEAILSPYEDAIKTYELVRPGPTYPIPAHVSCGFDELTTRYEIDLGD